MHPPGLYVVMPSTPYDAKGLLKAAIRSDNPVVFIEHKATYGQMGPVPEGDYIIPLGVADIKRPGNDATIVSYSRMVMRSLEAGKILADEHGIDAEVIDVRTLKPLDMKTIAESVRKTGRLITVSEGFCWCGAGREIAGQYMEYDFGDGSHGFDYLGGQGRSAADERAARGGQHSQRPGNRGCRQAGRRPVTEIQPLFANRWGQHTWRKRSDCRS